jgi:hypothetical protein
VRARRASNDSLVWVMSVNKMHYIEPCTPHTPVRYPAALSQMATSCHTPLPPYMCSVNKHSSYTAATKTRAVHCNSFLPQRLDHKHLNKPTRPPCRAPSYLPHRASRNSPVCPSSSPSASSAP